MNAKSIFCGPLLMTRDLNSDLNTRNGKKMVDICNLFNLKLHIDKPTYFNMRNNTSSILDQFISNCSMFIKKIEVDDPVSVNDHSIICFWLNFKIP